MAKYERHDADVFLVPSNPFETFLNSNAGTITNYTDAQVLPFSLVTEEFPIIKPKRNDLEVHGVGGGRNPTGLLEHQYEIGAGSIPNKCIFGLMIPKIGGDVSVTHTAAEVTTVTCVADDTSSLNNEYFEFDVMLAAGTLKKYFVWFNVAGAGAVPTPAPVAYGAARTAAVVAFAANATANEVAAAIQLVINALDDVTCANPGAPSPTLTITNDQNGAVDDTHDGAGDPCGFTFVCTTNGRTKVEIIFDATTIEGQNYGFHTQRILSGQNRMIDLFGCTIGTYEMTCEETGVCDENVDFTVAAFKTGGADIAKMYAPDGRVWNKGNTPYLGTKKNFNWASFADNFTFTMSGTLISTKKGFSIRIENELHHNYDGGGEFASGVDFGLRHIEIGLNAKVEDVTIFELADQHVLDYAGDILLQIKGIRGSDTNDYIDWDFSKLVQKPIPEKIAAPAEWVERYDLILGLAAGCVAKCTIEGYLSYEYYTGKDWI